MLYDGCRLKCCEDLLKLKQIVSDIWNLEGKWSSPGGQSKRFCSSNADLVLTWHKGKQNTLILHGKDGDLVRDKCILLCSQNNQYLLISPIIGSS